MPTNLPPEYFDAEKRYRTASTSAEKLACIEEMLAIIPKHKGTDKLRADLRKRVSKLKSAAQAKKSLARHESAYHINKEGAGQVVIVGATNVGKSALVATVTHAAPEVADFPHTTWKPTPGMMPIENIQIQLIDTPPLSKEFVDPEMMDLIRRCDLVLLMVDLQTDPLQQLEDTVAVLGEHRIVPLRLKDRYRDQRGISLVPFLIMANKNDNAATDENLDIFRELLSDNWPMIAASVATGRNLDLLKATIVERLNIIRVYSKSHGQKPDRSSPFVLKKGSTIADFACKVHQDFAQKLKAAKVWGIAVFDGQMVQRDYVLQEGDIIELQI
ncbi:MAG: TGS domain-containing protein [Desulfobacterales bacterium]|nr:TGS domain-containing protein [Desulfobacterales bacterium]